MRCDRQELAYATERLGTIFTKMIAAVQQGNDVLLRELGIPSQMFGAVRLPMMRAIPTLIGRFDFARTAEGLKMLGGKHGRVEARLTTRNPHRTVRA
ncbi:glutathionylspermidine synthase family protein, partial [Pelosinus baikalensis]|uniref:glutathionylspermidine synthase family protein n=1 Tax=Pelosinus baikalensis TaxID=2892015 RepID=UPI001E3A4D7B